jgi:hypothetical protein
MVSQKRLEKFNEKELQEHYDKTIVLIDSLKIIIKDYDALYTKLINLAEEANDLSTKSNSLYYDELSKDYKEETKFFGKNKGILDIYFKSKSQEHLFLSTYENATKKITEKLKHEKQFGSFGSRNLDSKNIVWGEAESSMWSYDYVNAPWSKINKMYYTGEVDVTDSNRTTQLNKKMGEINVYNRIDTFQRRQILTKDNYKEFLERYEREKRKIELLVRQTKKRVGKEENIGTIYIMSNESLPKDTYKIGSTYGLAEERAEELTGTGHLNPFIVVGEIKIQSAEYYEKLLHKLLDDYRVKKGREFFKLDLGKIKECLEQVSEISRKGEDKITLSELKKEIKL